MEEKDIAPVLVLMGPPGAGRGTQARLLANRLSRPRISTGEMLRSASLSPSPFGEEVRKAQKDGDLVGDEVVAHLVRDRMFSQDCRDGVVFHGYPATAGQARALDGLVANADDVLALSVVVPHEVLFSRLAGRRICSECGAVYNVFTSPALRDGVCDRDGAALVRRPDDDEDQHGRRAGKMVSSQPSSCGQQAERTRPTTVEASPGRHRKCAAAVSR